MPTIPVARLTPLLLAVAVPLVAQGPEWPEERQSRRRFSIGASLGAATFTALRQESAGAPVGRRTRFALTTTATLAAHLSPRLALRSDVMVGSTRATDVMRLFTTLATLAGPVDDTDEPDPRAGNDEEERGGESAVLSFSPVLEWRVGEIGTTLLRAGPTWLGSWTTVGFTERRGAYSVPAPDLRTSGWGLRLGLSTLIGGPDSPLSLSADVMRVAGASGPVTMIPVSIGVRFR
jgi:hypothetical protein